MSIFVPQVSLFPGKRAGGAESTDIAGPADGGREIPSGSLTA